MDNPRGSQSRVAAVELGDRVTAATTAVAATAVAVAAAVCYLLRDNLSMISAALQIRDDIDVGAIPAPLDDVIADLALSSDVVEMIGGLDGLLAAQVLEHLASSIEDAVDKVERDSATAAVVNRLAETYGGDPDEAVRLDVGLQAVREQMGLIRGRVESASDVAERDPDAAMTLLDAARSAVVGLDGALTQILCMADGERGADFEGKTEHA